MAWALDKTFTPSGFVGSPVTVTTPTGGVAAGQVVVVFFGGGTPTSVTDARSNTYTLAVTAGSSAVAKIYYSVVSTPLVAGDLITATGSGGFMDAASFTPASGTVSLDQVGSRADAFSSSPSTVASSATTVAAELSVGFLFAISTVTGFSNNQGYTDLHINNSSGGRTIETGYKILAATGAQTYGGTGWSAASTYSGVLATFKAVAGAAFVPRLTVYT